MRFWSLLLAGSLLVAASSAMAEDGSAPKDAAAKDPALELLEDVVDGVGGFLKILAGPPLTPPPPLNLPGASDSWPAPVAKPAAEPPVVALPPPETAPVVPAPIPAVVTPPSAPPPPPVPVAIVPPAPVPMVPMPAARPVVAPKPIAMTPPPPTEPACRTRAAATATLEQAAKLPRCGP